MARPKTFFQCQACGCESPKWLGRCPECGQWNTFSEEKEQAKQPAGRGAIGGGRRQPVRLSDIKADEGMRATTNMPEFDRVLGGGLVGGSVVLIGGDPGIGKSTLIMQAAAAIGGKVLYASGEESPEQIKLRAERLGLLDGDIELFPETDVDSVMHTAKAMNPAALVVDSIQTMHSGELTSAPGSVGQVRECAARLMIFAKSSGIPVFIIGHVTKEGAIAGPRVLEHIVDTVLYFEGERGHAYRILRTVKNRFGATNEIGVFEMSDSGLKGIDNPSELFLSEKPSGVPGSVVAASIEGTRPLLVEIQALVSQSTFGMPRRTSIGMDYQRVNLLVAVLEKVAGLHLGGMDIFTNVAGGLKIVEPAIDLGVSLAIASSLRELPIKAGVIAFGEVGLSGEIRAVSQADSRLKEAAKIGFKHAVMPEANLKRLHGKYGLEISGVGNLREALSAIGL